MAPPSLALHSSAMDTVKGRPEEAGPALPEWHPLQEDIQGALLLQTHEARERESVSDEHVTYHVTCQGWACDRPCDLPGMTMWPTRDEHATYQGWACDLQEMSMWPARMSMWPTRDEHVTYQGWACDLPGMSMWPTRDEHVTYQGCEHVTYQGWACDLPGMSMWPTMDVHVTYQGWACDLPGMNMWRIGMWAHGLPACTKCCFTQNRNCNYYCIHVCCCAMLLHTDYWPTWCVHSATSVQWISGCVSG